MCWLYACVLEAFTHSLRITQRYACGREGSLCRVPCVHLKGMSYSRFTLSGEFASVLHRRLRSPHICEEARFQILYSRDRLHHSNIILLRSHDRLQRIMVAATRTLETTVYSKE